MKNRIEEIKQRLELATKGEWASLNYLVFAQSGSTKDFFDIEICRVDMLDNDLNHEDMIRNIDFIAHSKSDIEYLLEKVERYEKALSEINNLNQMKTIRDLEMFKIATEALEGYK